MKKLGKSLGLLALVLILVLSLTGCTSKEQNPQAQTTGYPLSFQDGYNYTTTLEKKPERIVSVSPNITEILCSLGLEEKIVGRTDYCDYPQTISSIPSVGDILNPSIEKITEIKPDVVLSEGMQSSNDFSDSLRNLGIKVINLRANTSLEGTYEMIQNTGNITGKAEEATKIVTNMKEELSQITKKLEGIEKKTVFYVVGFGEYGLSTATGDTFVNDILQKAGFVNVASDGSNWSYSNEKLYEKNPEYIICSQNFNTKEGIKADSILKDLPAVKADKIIEIDNNKLDRQTVRNIEVIKELVKAIYQIEV